MKIILSLFLLCILFHSCQDENPEQMFINDLCLSHDFDFTLIGVEYGRDNFDFEQIEVYRLLPSQHLEFINEILDKDSKSCISWTANEKFIDGKKSDHEGLEIKVEYSQETRILTIWTQQL